MKSIYKYIKVENGNIIIPVSYLEEIFEESFDFYASDKDEVQNLFADSIANDSTDGQLSDLYFEIYERVYDKYLLDNPALKNELLAEEKGQKQMEDIMGK